MVVEREGERERGICLWWSPQHQYMKLNQLTECHSRLTRPVPFHFAPSSPAVSLCLLPLPTHTSPDPCPTPQAHPLVFPSLANPLESAHMMVLLRTMCADAGDSNGYVRLRSLAAISGTVMGLPSAPRVSFETTAYSSSRNSRAMAAAGAHIRKYRERAGP